MDSTEDESQRVAERVREGMFANDAAAHALGIQVSSIGPGRAQVTMTVRADMLNGHGICHGGLVTTLADTAFAYACNSHNERPSPPDSTSTCSRRRLPGDLLTADAGVVSQGRPHGRLRRRQCATRRRAAWPCSAGVRHA